AEVFAERGLQLQGQLPVGVVELRRTDALEVLQHYLRQGQVRDDLVTIGIDLEGNLGASHLGGRLGDIFHPVELVFDILVGIGADVVPDLGGGRHHVRLSAAVGNDVMNAIRLLHVLAHVIDADVHQLNAVQGAAAFLRASGRVGGQPGERELG